MGKARRGFQRFAVLLFCLILTADGVAGSGPSIKFGVCDWTLGKSGSPEAFALAKKLGFDGVQVSLLPQGDSLVFVDNTKRAAFLDAAGKRGQAIASFALGILNDVPLKNDPRAERWLGEAIGICRDTGVKVILVPFFGKGDLRNDSAGVDACVAALRRLAPNAERAGVVLALESYLSADELLKILDRVGSPSVQIYYDVANSQAAGLDIAREIPLLGKRIAEIHAKDTKDLYGKGSMDFPLVRKAMEEIGYGGWFVVEGTKLPLGLEPSLRYDLDYLKTIFRKSEEDR